MIPVDQPGGAQATPEPGHPELDTGGDPRTCQKCGYFGFFEFYDDGDGRWDIECPECGDWDSW